MKKAFRIILKTFLGLIGFVLLYLAFAFVLSRIAIEKEKNTTNDIAIYILSNGVHTDIVVPVKSEFYDWSQEVKYTNTYSKDTSYPYLAMGWGDKGFYLETPAWKNLKASVAFKAAFALGNSAIHATFHDTMIINDQCKKIMISKHQYQRFVNFMTNSFKRDRDGHFIHINTKAVYGNHDAFYEATGSYSMLHTCNTWANNALKTSGQRCCLWTPFDTGIFCHYK